MLTIFGDILNWAAAAILFPLMLLPLAALFGRSAIISTAFWLVLVAGLIGAGLAFAALAPRLGADISRDGAVALVGGIAALATGVLLVGGPRRASERLAPLFTMVTRRAGRAVMWLVFLMAFVQVSVVFLRYVFGLSFLVMQESITYMHGAVFLLAAGYALLTDDHVRVDIFYRGASPKRKALVDLLGAYLFLFPVCLVLLWAVSPYVGQSWAVREGSAEASGIPALFLLKSCIPAFAVLLAMAGFATAARAGETLRRKA